MDLQMAFSSCTILSMPKTGEFYDGKLWFSRKGSTLTLGLTGTGVETVGEIESIEFPSEGEDFDKGETIVTIDGTQGSIELTTPAAGVIQEINETLKEEPEVATEDPFEQGWFVKLEIQDKTDLDEYGGIDQ